MVPIIFVECLPDSRIDSVIVNHGVIATRASLELKLVVGGEVGEVFHL